MPLRYNYSRHALERSSMRNIPQMIAELILDFGQSIDAGDGARKYALDKEAMRQIRKVAGRAIAKIIESYRNRNVYVVAVGGKIVTVAFASRPLFS